jgi:hypothetical protein
VCWNLSYRSDRYWTPVRPVGPIQEQVRSIGLIWSLYRLPEPFIGLVRYWIRLVQQTIWPLEFELHRTSPAITGHVRVLTQICQFRKFPSESALSSVGVTIPVWPIWWTGLTDRVWQPHQRFLDSLQKVLHPHSRGLLVPGRFHNLLTASWALPNLSLWDPSLSCNILELGGEICVASTNPKPWATSSTREAFVTLGGEAS